jgi:hypothetical protein
MLVARYHCGVVEYAYGPKSTDRPDTLMEKEHMFLYFLGFNGKTLDRCVRGLHDHTIPAGIQTPYS